MDAVILLSPVNSLMVISRKSFIIGISILELTNTLITARISPEQYDRVA
jgi:hypothetical protein